MESRPRLKHTTTCSPARRMESRPRIGNDPIQNQPRRAAGLPELDADQRQGFTGITCVVRERSATDAARFVFPSYADEERVPPRRLGRLKHGHGTAARCDHGAIRKADPLIAVLIEQLLADS